jgi:hypothetical protein
MNIIVRLITGVIQDRDNNSYDNVVVVYAILAGLSVAVSIVLIGLAWWSVDLGHLQWSRKTRIARGAVLNERKELFCGKYGRRNKLLSQSAFGALLLLVAGSWCGYFWGLATGNHY